MVKKYIRNRDLKHFTKKEYSKNKGVVLTKYYGTIKKAMSKGVPIYNTKGIVTHTPS